MAHFSKKTFQAVMFGMLFLFGSQVYAHLPIVNTLPSNPLTVLNKFLNVGAAQIIPDPSVTSEAIYDALLTPGDVRLYSFTAEKDAVIPVEVLVPVKHSNANFRPSVALIYWVGGVSSANTLPFSLPNNYGAIIADVPAGPRSAMFEPYSFERLYRGSEIKIQVEAEKRYYIAVYEPNKQIGDYAIVLGTVENFSGVSYVEFVKNVIKLKLELVGGRFIPWRDLSGLFLMLLGLIIGFGTVLIVSALFLLARRGIHFSEMIIRVHTIIEPLVWVGLFLLICGGILFFWQIGLAGIPALLTILATILLLNADFMHNHVYREFVKYEKESHTSRKLPAALRAKVFASTSIFFISWTSVLFLLVWYLLL